MEAVRNGQLVLHIGGERLVAVGVEARGRGDREVIEVRRRIGIVEGLDVEEIDADCRVVIRPVPLLPAEHHVADGTGGELSRQRAVDRPFVDAGGELRADLRAGGGVQPRGRAAGKDGEERRGGVFLEVVLVAPPAQIEG